MAHINLVTSSTHTWMPGGGVWEVFMGFTSHLHKDTVCHFGLYVAPGGGEKSGHRKWKDSAASVTLLILDIFSIHTVDVPPWLKRMLPVVRRNLLCGSNGRVLALKVWNQEFKIQSHQKKKKKKNEILPGAGGSHL
jgi:hypothetical protein